LFRHVADEALLEISLPGLFREKSFTCVTLAEAVNHYVDLGEEAASKELEALAWSGILGDDQESATGRFSRYERITWVCRILFAPKGSSPLRPAALGAPCFPSVALTAWPLFPVAAAGTSYFVLSQGYVLAGRAEDPTAYLPYCRANGKFRTARVPVPTRVQALKHLQQLHQSAAWKAIKWGEAGDDWTWRYIKAQAENIPAR
jgi:hypothetical protein